MYDAAGHVLNVRLTGTTPDQDIYSYDPNTGRMKTFEFEVGNTPANLTGTLTWNPNGSHGKLQIVDGFNAGGSETCYSNSSSALGYGYDDWGRLVAFDCGSGNWGQQFSYDQYDNLTQTVISGRSGSTWNPGYNSSANQVTGASYDSNGSMTNDGGSHVYGWNEFSKMKWTASSGTPACGTSGKCATYDAFGRMVEMSSGSAWKELWYPQVPGSTISMSGTTQNYAYWPSPGRGTFVDSGSDMFIHPDWLGNDRVVSSPTGHTVTADRAYAPYGEQYNTFGSTNPIYGMYASITGDYDSGILFDTPNRELAQYQGRWLSPDPAGQGWNQYAYPTDPNSSIDPSGLMNYVPWLSGLGLITSGGPFGGNCVMDGVDTPCDTVYTALQSGGAAQCPNNNCSPQYIRGQWQNFGAWADGSSGYMPGSLAGFSTLDAANALAIVTAAASKLGTPIDPASLTGRGAGAYRLLTDPNGVNIAPGDITIYQNDGGDFEAVLSAQGFASLMSGLASNPGDAFLHYPYTDGARDYLDTNSLHGVWFDPNLTNYVGGSGIYMQFHTDADNPWQGSMWGHMMCVLFNAGC